jgi:hypothetical protein
VNIDAQKAAIEAMKYLQGRFLPRKDENNNITGYLDTTSGEVVSKAFYAQKMEEAQRMMTSAATNQPGPTVNKSPAGLSPATAQVANPSTASTVTVQPPAVSAQETNTPTKYKMDSQGFPIVEPNDPASYEARAIAISKRTATDPTYPNRDLLVTEANNLTSEARKLRSDATERTMVAGATRDTEFLKSGQSFLPMYPKLKNDLQSTKEIYRNFEAGPYADTAFMAAKAGNVLGLDASRNYVSGYTAAQKQAEIDAGLSVGAMGLTGAPAAALDSAMRAVHGPTKPNETNYKIITSKEAALDFQRDLVEGFKASGSRNIDEYTSKFLETHDFKDYEMRSRMNTPLFKGTTPNSLQAIGVELPQPVNASTPKESLVEGKYYTTNGKLLKWAGPDKGYAVIPDGRK